MGPPSASEPEPVAAAASNVAAVVELTLRPRGPFSLRDSAVWASDATRRFDGRVLVALFAVEDGLARACAWQQADGRIELRSHSEEAL